MSLRDKIGTGVRSAFSVENVVNQLVTYGLTGFVTLYFGLRYSLPWWGWFGVGLAAFCLVGAAVLILRRTPTQETASPESGDALKRAIQQHDWQEVMLLLAETHAGDWNVLHDIQRQDDGHWYRAVYKPDITLAVEWGAVPSFNRGDPDREFEEDWNRRFPDTSARMYLVEVIFNGGIVHQSHFASVDGGRGYVPVPTPHVTDDDEDEPIRDYYYASAQDVALTRLIHDLTEKTPSFDFYMERSGIRVPAEHVPSWLGRRSAQDGCSSPPVYRCPWLQQLCRHDAQRSPVGAHQQRGSGSGSGLGIHLHPGVAAGLAPPSGSYGRRS